MNFGNSKLAIALNKSNKCHNDKYMERLLNSPALQYNKELNYIYITLPRGEEHMVDQGCIDEYYSWLSEYLTDEIDRVKIERDTIKIGIIDGFKTKEQKDVYTRLLTNPSDEQIDNMIGFNPREDKNLIITENRLKVALERQIRGVKTQAQDDLIREIDRVYHNRVEKLSDLVVKYEKVLKELNKKINDVEANRRIFDLQESKKKRIKPKKSKKRGKTSNRKSTKRRRKKESVVQQ
jgi:hypothetical protein